MTSHTDPGIYVTSYAYDDAGNLSEVAVPDPDGNGPLTTPVTTYEYDALGRRTDVVDPLGRRTTSEYDDLGRLTLLLQPDPDGPGPLTRPGTVFQYDASGNLLSAADALGHTTTYEYDLLGRKVQSTDAEEGVVAYTYNEVGDLLALVDPEGNETTYAYDNLGRLLTETNELDDSRAYVYDAAGQLIEQTDRNGRVRTFAYDGLGRRTTETWLDENEDPVETLEWSYDVLSRLLTAENAAASYTYSYDALGRLVQTSTAGGPGPEVVLSAGFDLRGNRTSLAAAIDSVADFANAYQYDGLGRTTRVTQTGQSGGAPVADKRIDLAYNAAGQYELLTRYADLAAEDEVAHSAYTYDFAGRLTSLVHAQTTGLSTNPLAEYTWSYDVAGRLTGFVSADGSLTYTYDDTNQLTAATPWIGTAEEFAYDANGNRTNTGYITGPNNRLLSDGTHTYEYDAEGNRTRKTTIATGEAVEYGWDHRNRLVSVTYLDDQAEIVKTVAYDYDAFDRKVAKRVDDDGDGNVDRAYRYVYDDAGKLDPAAGVPLDDVVLVFDAAGSLTTRNLPGPGIDEIFASEDFEQTVLWPLADHQGSIRDVATYDSVTGESSVVNHIRYSAFGEVLDQLANPGQTGHLGESADEELQSFLFAYTGREYDPDADLHYYRARWYDPAAGRFVSEDPLGFVAGDVNLQRYVGNAAIYSIDPSGMQPPSSTLDALNNTRTMTILRKAQKPPASQGDYWDWNKDHFIPWTVGAGIIGVPFEVFPTAVMEGFAETREIIWREAQATDDDGKKCILYMGYLMTFRAQARVLGGPVKNPRVPKPPTPPAKAPAPPTKAPGNKSNGLKIEKTPDLQDVEKAIGNRVHDVHTNPGALKQGKPPVPNAPPTSPPTPSKPPAAPKSAKSILDGLPGKSGKTGPIKEVPDEKALDELFDSLSTGGKTVNPGKYPGVVRELTDGTIIRRRPGSKSGGATLDITMPNGRLYKVHTK